MKMKFIFMFYFYICVMKNFLCVLFLFIFSFANAQISEQPHYINSAYSSIGVGNSGNICNFGFDIIGIGADFSFDKDEKFFNLRLSSNIILEKIFDCRGSELSTNSLALYILGGVKNINELKEDSSSYQYTKLDLGIGFTGKLIMKLLYAEADLSFRPSNIKFNPKIGLNLYKNLTMYVGLNFSCKSYKNYHSQTSSGVSSVVGIKINL